MSSGAHNAAKPGGQKFKHSLKTVGRTVMAAQRFAEGASFDNDDGGTSAHASNMHRSEASVPFGALIHFMTFSTEPELSKPWQMKKPQVSTGTGFYIGNKRILTNSHVIRHSTSLRVERHGQPGNFPARVLCEGVMCDLALVTVDDDEFFEDLPAVRLQEDVPELDDTVICLGYPLGATSITVTRGVVSNVHMKDLSLRGWNDENLLLAVQIDAAINPGNSGGPVFSYKTAAVVGVAFAGRVDVQGIGFIIPVPVIQLFVKTFEVTKHPIFAGLPMLGIATQDLVNPSLRRLCFGATTPPSRDGILVTEVHKDSCADRAGLMPGDVLVCIDETPISEKGDVPFRGHERLDWVYLVTRKPLGSKITLDVLRRIDGGVAGNKAVSLQNGTLEARRLHVTLAPTPSLLPSILGLDYTPGWVVIGGLLFLRVGQPLLDQIISGGRGAGVGGFTHITSLMGIFEKDSVSAGVDEAVILMDVLAHDINISYEEYRGLVLYSINGTQIKSLRHLAQFYADCADAFLHIEFGGGGHKERHAEAVVLEQVFCQRTQLEILAQHKIPNWCSDDCIPAGGTAAFNGSSLTPVGSSLTMVDPMALLYALAGGAPLHTTSVQHVTVAISSPPPQQGEAQEYTRNVQGPQESERNVQWSDESVSPPPPSPPPKVSSPRGAVPPGLPPRKPTSSLSTLSSYLGGGPK